MSGASPAFCGKGRRDFVTTPVDPKKQKEAILKVDALIRKALSTESEEESRTCALTAVKLIVKEKLVVISSHDAAARAAIRGNAYQNAVNVTKSPRGSPQRRSPPVTPPTRTGFATTCLFCGDNIAAGDMVFWSKTFDVTVCAGCYEEEILMKSRMDSIYEKGR